MSDHAHRFGAPRAPARFSELSPHLVARCLLEVRNPQTQLAPLGAAVDCVARRTGLVGPSSRRAIRQMIDEMATAQAIHLRRGSILGEYAYAEVPEASLRHYLRDLVASEE